MHFVKISCGKKFLTFISLRKNQLLISNYEVMHGIWKERSFNGNCIRLFFTYFGTNLLNVKMPRLNPMPSCEFEISTKYLVNVAS